MSIKIKYLFVLSFSSIIAACQTTNKPEQIDSVSILENKVEQEEQNSINQKDTTVYEFTWKNTYFPKHSIINNINAPTDYQRVEMKKNSFGDWLRHLPLKDNNTVFLYDGQKKSYQYAQYRVIDIDVGDKDLQQCADAVIRLRAEYLYSNKEFNQIHFNYSNGTNIPFSKWSTGYYPSLKGNKVTWVSRSENNPSYPSFKKYMTNIFMYAGTASLEKELVLKDINEIAPGDVFIKGGFPGHAVIVIDVAINNINGDKVFMLAQSYMPAQDIHILQNFENDEISPWYSISECKQQVRTPEWVFEKNQLRSFTK